VCFFREILKRNVFETARPVGGRSAARKRRRRRRRGAAVEKNVNDNSLVDPASSHMLVSKIKPCMSQYKPH
jgi:hypothetical protein